MDFNGKKLYKVREGKMICGVCQGMGEYFGIDPNLVRLGMVLFGLFAFAGVIFYIAAAIILPEKYA